ncbi:biogenesis of lysosome-related organelles complex 1 subunit 5 [Cynoglossus semilaevis]|uniref:Biogenesis of lysosome-related organelles complex 1 subunit 5 n=1 Tax=Cynoglossus semilaevis TaxID=244447 RepID=A0A3P8VKG5_CYNSE|nr:biogenesis of lysosome-related organelles complex 1 subunit 5 [Cynoglossus semilaevis]
MEKIVKDVGDIQSRLLHHRPIINAEIRYFVREFEEKRGYRENRLLENLSKMVTEANDQLVALDTDSVNQGMITDLIRRLEAANHMAQRVQQREIEVQQGTQLQANIEHLKDDWSDFLKEQQRLKEEVDEQHVKAVGQLSTHYSEMKMNLTRFAPM